MLFEPPLISATLIRRYKRFLADVVLASGEQITVHCPNTGSMKNCVVPQSPCYLSDSNNPKRKYRYTIELVTTPGGHLAGVNTGRANALVEEAIHAGVVPELAGYQIQREQKYGEEGSRIDLLLSRGEKRCFVEVKNVTLAEPGGQGLFPDAVSIRGAKHLRELMYVRAQGHRAVLFFCVQHSGVNLVSPADDIDVTYGQLLREAASAGVEIFAVRASLSRCEIKLRELLPVVL